MENFDDIFLVMQFNDVTKMTSYLIFLKFYYVIINLKDHKLAKSRNFRLTRCKKAKLTNIFTKIVPSRARM